MIESRSRRSVLKGLAGVSALAALPPGLARAGAPRVIRPQPAEAQLVGPSYPKTAVWGYDGLIPGPTLRLRQGERLDVRLENGLPQPTTLHWHGLRLPNAMDGVPGVTQAAVEPGGSFDYAFEAPDAGTFWYHSHANSAEQGARGLAGPLIVEEATPTAGTLRVDREETWLLDDWRLTKEARIAEPMASMMDLSHGGRIGNTVTLNGVIPEAWPVTAGERVRLRLLNAANARFFALRFEAHAPWVVAVDGQPCTPFLAENGRVLLPPAGRLDLVVDLTGRPGARFEVVDDAYPRDAYRLLDIAYADEAPLRASALPAPMALPANPLAEPDLGSAETIAIVLEGGAMGGMGEATLGGKTMGLRALAERGKVWALNGVVAGDGEHPLLGELRLGRSYRLVIENRTAFPHPMHLHGHHYKLIARDGAPEIRGIWHDTVIAWPDGTVEVAFVADNPGDWLFHCHIPEHMMAGMTGMFRVG
ncbi:Multicopper oxidase with three cupredoxin domains (includes cell division protein FtsP and spore coat protein CotA) [Tistlia consotensis]|uniref:Multicopper oxidase with three cupredoxin domains (Includes cell division protein FtsP and spore coat protein CotA) n=1 Tax=Tistlia consotensis USBA 355 TaxID=560819 RepID=A0A1Y6C7L8_9PROT|nr:multicopper oxidase family protein [Tistlia consotensis]SMF40821.1 Multicopper oxidase with three cupredoxin domains (includes cell division protein FtsP and spore coat protein CotA) [Tistlia consotensis USBA 355]SNR74393.1 Multicopper oxidase with three cupredoxin domains (includes cell division protein FtsP and spore coat protein CotA) [Tistlia consotensis]